MSDWKPPEGMTVEILHDRSKGLVDVAIVTLEPGRKTDPEVHGVNERIRLLGGSLKAVIVCPPAAGILRQMPGDVPVLMSGQITLVPDPNLSQVMREIMRPDTIERHDSRTVFIMAGSEHYLHNTGSEPAVFVCVMGPYAIDATAR